jgi:predicted MFS family arabinose efflux permease
MGQASAIVSVAGLTGTPIAGALIRSYGYEAAALFAGLSMVMCTCLAAVARGFYAGKLLAKV